MELVANIDMNDSVIFINILIHFIENNFPLSI